MSVNPSRVSTLFDIGDDVELKDDVPGFPRTKTTIEPAVRLVRLADAFWHDERRAGDGTVMVSIEVSNVAVAGDNAYRVEIISDDFCSMLTPRVLASIDIPARSFYRVPIDLRNAERNDPDAVWLAVRAIVTGSASPSIAYGARITRNVR